MAKKAKDLEQLVEVIKSIKSMCGTCNGKGTVPESTNIGVSICKCCDGKGYHTFEELLDRVEST
jgi:DnaJ-class molecular chaperone